MVTISELSKNWGVSHQYASRCVKRGCPLDDFESARLWRQANSKRAPRSALPTQPTSEASLKSSGKAGSLDDALENSARACQEAWFYLNEALIEGKPSKISVWLNLHNKAVEGRVKTEAMIRSELERQKVLIPSSEAQSMIRKVVEIIISRLAAMPSNIAPRCNPHAPEHAMDILQDECTAIIADAQKAVMS